MPKILLIDDDEVQLQLQRMLLSSQGYTVHSTADGPQGILLYKTLRPDLVLLDIGLPSISGIEVLKQIRQIDEKAKIIVITGYASVESAVLAIREGAWDYVRKPYDVNALLKKIESALSVVSK
ncbi:MAG TPA: response regulator [Bacteroidota bacterium]|nr:response regulator [Bacteroidota bacterium]